MSRALTGEESRTETSIRTVFGFAFAVTFSFKVAGSVSRFKRSMVRCARVSPMISWV